jgi:PAT family beta-lactamase induction signal transducer AmpG
VLFLLAYASATHDIACDGLYMGALDEKRQAAYAGWQGAFFNAPFSPWAACWCWPGGWRAMGVFNAWS